MKLYSLIFICLLGSSCSQIEEDELTAADSNQSISQEYEEIKLIAVPNIIDFSEKIAMVVLETKGIYCWVNYVPDKFIGPVVGMKYHNEFIKPGTKIPQGDTIIVYIGGGNDLGQELLYDQYMDFIESSEP